MSSLATEQIEAIKEIITEEYADKNEDLLLLDLVYEIGRLAGGKLNYSSGEDVYVIARIAALATYWREKFNE